MGYQFYSNEGKPTIRSDSWPSGPDPDLWRVNTEDVDPTYWTTLVLTDHLCIVQETLHHNEDEGWLILWR